MTNDQVVALGAFIFSAGLVAGNRVISAALVWFAALAILGGH